MAAAAPIPEVLTEGQKDVLADIIQSLINSAILEKRIDLLQDCIAPVPEYTEAEIVTALTGTVENVLYDNTRPEKMRYSWRSIDVLIKDKSLLKDNPQSFIEYLTVLKKYPSFNPVNLTAMQNFYQKLKVEIEKGALSEKVAKNLFLLRETFLEMGAREGELDFRAPRLIFPERLNESNLGGIAAFGNELKLGDVQNFIKKYVEQKIKEYSSLEKTAADSNAMQKKDTETKNISKAIFKFKNTFHPEGKDAKVEKEEYCRRFYKFFSNFLYGELPKHSRRWNVEHITKCVPDGKFHDHICHEFVKEFEDKFVNQFKNIFGEEMCHFILARKKDNDCMDPASIARRLRENPKLAKVIYAPELKIIEDEQAKQAKLIPSSFFGSVATTAALAASSDTATTHLVVNTKVEVAELKDAIEKLTIAKSLTVDGQWLIAEHLDAIGSALVKIPTIEKLCFGNCEFQSNNFFLSLTANKNIKTLTFNNVRLSSADVGELIAFIGKNNTVKTLEFRNCELSVDNMHNLLQAIADTNATLKNLVLTVSKFEHLERINDINFLDKHHLETLHLINNGIAKEEFDFNYHILSYNQKVKQLKCSCETKVTSTSACSTVAASSSREIQVELFEPNFGDIQYDNFNLFAKSMSIYLNGCWCALDRYLDLPISGIPPWELFEQKLSALLGLMKVIETWSVKDKSLELLRSLPENVSVMHRDIVDFLVKLPKLVYDRKKEPKDFFRDIDLILDKFIASLPKQFAVIYKAELDSVKMYNERFEERGLSSIRETVAGSMKP